MPRDNRDPRRTDDTTQGDRPDREQNGPRGGTPPRRRAPYDPTGPRRPGAYGQPDPNPVTAPTPGPGNTFPRSVPSGPAPHSADYDGGYDPYGGGPSVDTAPPSYQPPPPSYDAGGPQSYFPDLTTEDPRIMATQDRTFAHDRGNRIDADMVNELGYRRGLEGGYRGRMDNAYGDLNATPGYTAEESDAIQRTGSLSQLPVSRDEVDSWQFTGDEQAAIAGNPNNQRGWYNPAQTEGIANETAGNVNGALDQWGNNGRGAYSTMADNSRGALNRAQLGPTQDYMDQQDNAILAGEGNVRRSIGDYGSSIDGSLSTGRNSVDSYMSDPQMQFSPEDEAAMVQAASTSIGNNTRALRDRAEREAAASGNQSALALAAGLNDLQVQGGINAEDAALNAKVGARRLGVDAAQGRAALGTNAALALQRNELSAAGDLAGLETANEQQLARTRLGAAGEREGYRSDAERTRLQTDIANEHALGNSLMDFEATHGNARADYAVQTGDRRQNANQFNQTTGMEMERDIDNTAAERSRYIAGNRQGTAMAGQGVYFNQGFTTDQAGSQRAQTVADARRSGQGEYRGWATDQTNQNANSGTQARGQRTTAYGTQGQLAGDATQTQANFRVNQPGFGRTFSQSFAQSAGQTLGSPMPQQRRN